jgi:Fe-S cluster assembly protein SufB
MAILPAEIISSEYQFGFHDEIKYLEETKHGLSREVIEEISRIKDEPKWMLDFRLRAYEHFLKRPMPQWGGDLNQIDLDKIVYYRKASEGEEKSWDDVPDKIKQTFERLGIPEAERKFLSGVGAQYDSTVVYHNVREELSKIGVVFMGTDQGLKEYPELFKKYFATVVPPEDNKFAALNAAAWSGGSFVYVPKGVEVPLPLQAYFRINGQNTGQFERTLIIVDEGAKVHYIEGCDLKDTLVHTATGLRRIDEITPSELVLTHGGRWRQVKEVSHRSYNGRMIALRAFGHPRPLFVTAEHPLLVLPANYDPQKTLLEQQTIRMAENISPGDFLIAAIPKPSPKPLEELARHFEFGPASRKTGLRKEVEVRVPLDQDFYRLLGYYLSEGHVDQEHYLSLSFHAKEQNYLNDSEFLLQKFAGKATYRNKIDKNGQTIVLSDTRLARLFAREFGSTYRDKHVPPWITATSKVNLEALVLGMWRGDGSFDKKTEMFRYSSATQELAEVFRDALFNLGMTGLINCQTKRGGNRKPLYSVVIAQEHTMAFGKLVGLSFLTRKNLHPNPSRWLRDDNYLYLRVRKISSQEVENEEVWNLSVEEDETYMAGGVVSHNCTAPIYTTDALHAAVVEVIALPNSKVRYTTIQNWSNDVYNLVTKRAHAYAHSTVEWIDANTGCLTAESAICTSDSIKPISAIKPGDQVWSLSPEMILTLNKVLATRKNPPSPVYELILANGRRVRGTGNHPFLALHPQIHGHRLDWVCLSDLSPHDEVAVAGDLPNGLKLSVIEANNLKGAVNFIPVEKIAYVGELPTYDIEVSGPSNFIANGIFAHNSKLTMKYPSIYLMGEGATAEVISVAVAGAGQHQDTGAKAIHLAPNTKSRIISKSISKNGGRTTYRGSLKVASGATGVVASVRCDALLLDEGSRSDTYPYIDINEDDTTMTHEATVGKISQDQVFYLMSRGLNENEAMNLVVQGFLEIFTKELPMEYAIEFNRLVKLEMEGALG